MGAARAMTSGGPFEGFMDQTIFYEYGALGACRAHIYDRATGRYLGAQIWLEAEQAPLPYPGFNKRKIVHYPAPILSPTEAAFAKRIREE